MKNRERAQPGSPRHPPPQSKPTSNSTRKAAYEQPVGRPADRNPRQKETSSQRTYLLTTDNEFELIYKVKNSGKSTFPFDEESFESMLLLKSKNKIKRFSNNTKTKRQEKSSKKAQPAANLFQSTSSGLGRSNGQQPLPQRKEKRSDRMEMQQESSRLAGLHSLDRKRTSPHEENFRSPPKPAHKSKLATSAGNSRVDQSLKRTKSAEFQLKLAQVEIEPTKKSMLVLPKQQPAKKVHRNSNPDIRAPRSQIVRPSKQPLAKSRRQRKQEISTKQFGDEQEYIMLGDQIYPAEQLEELEGELSSMMMQRPTEIRMVNRHAGEIDSLRQEDEAFEDEFYSIQQYYDEKATLIQKVFRGFMVRKFVRMYRQQLKRQQQREQPPIKRTSIDSKVREEKATATYQPSEQLNLMEDQQSMDILVMPSREHLEGPSKPQQIVTQLPSTNTLVNDRLGTIMNEFEKLAGSTDQDQLLLRLKQFVKEKQQSKLSSDRDVELPAMITMPCQAKDDVTETLIVRENAIDLRLNTQHNILKKLLADGKLQPVDYDRRLVSVQKWAYNQKQEISRLRQLLRANVQRAAQIVKKAQEDISIVERVTLGQEHQIELEKVLDGIPSNSSDGFFFYPEDSVQQRPKSTGWHGSIPPKRQGDKQVTELYEPLDPAVAATSQNSNYNTNLKEIIEELKDRQRIKADIDMRIAMQMSYLKPTFLGPNTINTSMQAMHHFLTNFFRFVECYYRHEFLRMINMPYGYSPERRLRFLQGYDCNSQEEQVVLEDGMVEGVEKVIGTDIFAQFHENYYNEQLLEDEKAVLYDSIHNRAVFDAFNQALNLFRPYYLISGPPYLWNISEKALTFYFIAEENIEEVFEKTKYKVLKWASTLCGLQLVECQPSIQQNSNKLQEMIDGKSTCHKVLGECREERLLKSLKHHVGETDYQWTLFEQQRTDIMLDLSTILLNRLMEEAALDILSFY